MNAKLVEDIADAILYEGYMLYPYRASAVKNQQRWNFGVLYPPAFAEAQTGNDRSDMQTECLARCKRNSARLNIRVRFLHLLERTTDHQLDHGWQEGTERDVRIHSLELKDLASKAYSHSFAFSACVERDESIARLWEQVEGRIDFAAELVRDDLFKVRLRASNTTQIEKDAIPSRDRALLRSLVSAHTILGIENGEFISLLDPPDYLRETVARCENVGTWPVLVGEEGQCDAMLSSPIILYDYPKIAPESAGSLFDGTEIDEILTLRIMTMTDEEKAEMAQTDERARAILERTECMPPEQLMKMHGAVRSLRELHEEAL